MIVSGVVSKVMSIGVVDSPAPISTAENTCVAITADKVKKVIRM